LRIASTIIVTEISTAAIHASFKICAEGLKSIIPSSATAPEEADWNEEEAENCVVEAKQARYRRYVAQNFVGNPDAEGARENAFEQGSRLAVFAHAEEVEYRLSQQFERLQSPLGDKPKHNFIDYK